MLLCYFALTSALTPSALICYWSVVFLFFILLFAVILSTRISLKMIKVPSYPEKNWEKSLKLKVFSLFTYYSSINLHIFEFLIKYSVLWNWIILFPTFPPPPPSSTLWPSYTSQMLLLPPRRLFFFFSVEFSVSPFQTFFNSGIKGTGGLGRLGYGILQALSENLQIKKALLWFWFGGVVVVGRGWGEEGRSEQTRGAGGGVVGRAAAFWAFRKKKDLEIIWGDRLYCRRKTSFLFLFCWRGRRFFLFSVFYFLFWSF